MRETIVIAKRLDPYIISETLWSVLWVIRVVHQCHVDRIENILIEFDQPSSPIRYSRSSPQSGCSHLTDEHHPNRQLEGATPNTGKFHHSIYSLPSTSSLNTDVTDSVNCSYLVSFKHTEADNIMPDQYIIVDVISLSDIWYWRGMMP